MGALDRRWEGVVRLRESVTVPEGATLDILPGTRVVIERGSAAGIFILGDLSAAGAQGPASEIVFFPEADWAGIVFSGSSKGDLRHVRIEGGPGASMECRDSAQLLLTSVMFGRGATGLRCAGAGSAALASSGFADHAAIGVLAEDDSVVRVEDGFFTRNATGIAAKGRARVSLNGVLVQASAQCGVNTMEGAVLRATGCRFEGNQTAVSVRDEGQGEVRDNRFRANAVGVHAKGRARVNLWGNVFHVGPTHDVDVIEDATISARRQPLLPAQAAA